MQHSEIVCDQFAFSCHLNVWILYLCGPLCCLFWYKFCTLTISVCPDDIYLDLAEWPPFGEIFAHLVNHNYVPFDMSICSLWLFPIYVSRKGISF